MPSVASKHRRAFVVATTAVVAAGAAVVVPPRLGSGDGLAASAAAALPDSEDLLVGVSRASARVATRVKASVVFIIASGQPDEEPMVAAAEPAIPPELLPFLPQVPRLPSRPPGARPGAPGGAGRGGVVSAGSGVIVSSDGYVLTNRHVVADARRVRVRLLDRREVEARVVGADASTDLAVLKIDAPRLVPATLGNSDGAQVGDWVFAVGNPLGEALTFSVTSGIISAKGRVLDLPGISARSIQDFLQTDAAINAGNSGGPLIDARGTVIGINTAIASPTGTYAGYGFAVPINLARTVLRQLTSRGRVERAMLGVRIRDAASEDADYVGLPEIRGVLVEDVEAGSPAARGGLRPGDVIVAIDGTPVDHVAQLQEAVTFLPPGQRVSLQVARKGGARATVAVVLQRVPDDPATTRSAAAAGPPGGATAPTLGVRVIPTADPAARGLRLPADVRGLVVVGVADESPASGHVAPPERGGPDVIEAVEGEPVPTPEALRTALQRAGVGSVVTLALYNVPTRSRRVERVRLSAPPADAS